MSITIKELSEISGYSITTISRVITNKGNVKKKRRKRFKSFLSSIIIGRMSWTSLNLNRAARSLWLFWACWITSTILLL